MKINLDKKVFLKNLQLINKVLKVDSRKSPVSAFELNTKKEKIVLETSNSLAELKLYQNVKYLSDFSLKKFLIPIDNLIEYLRFLPQNDVLLEFKDKKLYISQGSSHAQIGLINDGEQVVTKDADLNPVLKLDSDIIENIDKVALSVSSDDSRPILTCVLMEKNKKDKLRMVGTDGYRLSVFDFNNSYNLDQQVLIPAKLLSLVLHNVPVDDVQLSLDLSAQKVLFYGKKYQFGVRVVSGDFPPYQKIITENYITEAEVDRQQFLSAVDQLSVFSRQAANTLILKISDKEILLKTKQNNLGQGEITVPAKIEGDAVEIGFNFRYLQEFLRTVKEEVITLRFNGSLAPAAIGSGQDSFKYIVMPVKMDQ